MRKESIFRANCYFSNIWQLETLELVFGFIASIHDQSIMMSNIEKNGRKWVCKSLWPVALLSDLGSISSKANDTAAMYCSSIPNRKTEHK